MVKGIAIKILYFLNLEAYIYIYIYMRNLESHMKLEINYDALQYIFLYCPSIGVQHSMDCCEIVKVISGDFGW